MQRMKSIYEILDDAQNKWGDRPYIYTKVNGVYEYITYGDFIEQMRKVAADLKDAGYCGKNMMIYGANSVEYMLCDLAVLAHIGTTVNVNARSTVEQLGEAIDKMNVSVVLYSEEKEPNIKELKVLYPNVAFHTMQEVAAKAAKRDKVPASSLPTKTDTEGVKIVFTSGTTSAPKGVLLSLKNIYSGWEPLQRRTPFADHEIVYFFLPLHHTYGNIYNFLFSFLSGLSIYLCSDTNLIAQEILEVNPTIFCAVPLIYRRILEAYGDKVSMAFGNRIKYLFCGGAMFKPEFRKAYKDAGLPMFEAYALSETASSFSIEYPNKDDFTSVGTLFENVDARVLTPDEDGYGPIQVKGDCLFSGYYNDEERNKEVFTEDGYFITGDLGKIENGKVYLRGRYDKVIVGENGENKY